MNNMQLILHVGAHRTGSTSLQWRLDASSDTLRQNGIVALTPPREGKRGLPTLREAVKALPSMRGPWPELRQRAALRHARSLLADRISTEMASTRVKRLILSDENMLGSPFGPEGESVYPAADRKLAALARILPENPAEVHLVLRSYDSFLGSAYAMSAVYAGGVAPFEKIRSKLVAVDHGWPDLLKVLRRNFPSARLVLSTHELTGADVRFRRLINLSTDLLKKFNFSSRNLNPAPTMPAIEGALGQSRSSYDPDQLLKAHVNGTVFDPLSPNEKDTLSNLYARDCAEISALPNVEWIPSD